MPLSSHRTDEWIEALKTKKRKLLEFPVVEPTGKEKDKEKAAEPPRSSAAASSKTTTTLASHVAKSTALLNTVASYTTPKDPTRPNLVQVTVHTSNGPQPVAPAMVNPAPQPPVPRMLLFSGAPPQPAAPAPAPPVPAGPPPPQPPAQTATTKAKQRFLVVSRLPWIPSLEPADSTVGSADSLS